MIAWIVLALVAGERLAELYISERHTKALIREGAFEAGRGHYLLVVAVHVGWLAALFSWLGSRPVEINFAWLLLYALLQVARVWVMTSLGRFWTTRIIVVPGVPLVRKGPYKFLSHPNYAVVVAEILVLPLVYGAWQIAALFSVLNALVLAIRIRAENQALAARRALS